MRTLLFWFVLIYILGLFSYLNLSSLTPKSSLGKSSQDIADEKNYQSKLNKINSEIFYWQDVVTKKNDYRDGYLKLAQLEDQVGNTSQAKIFLDKALDLDPNNGEIKKREAIIATGH